jgi:hypothetical protein
MKMKTTLTLLAFAIFTAAAPALRAQEPQHTLYDDDITVSGRIFQGPLVSGDAAILAAASIDEGDSMVLSIANVLKVLGITGVDPKTQQYYYDADEGAIVIAPKGIASGDLGTVTATLLRFVDSVGWNKNAKQGIAAGFVRGFDDDLRGTSFENTTYKGGGNPSINVRKSSSVKTTKINDFVVWGYIGTEMLLNGNGIETIVKGRIVGKPEHAPDMIE